MVHRLLEDILILGNEMCLFLEGRRKSKDRKGPKNPSTGCVQEFNANESRSGLISSSSLSLNNQGCTVIFRGQPGDVLLLSFNSYKLR